MKYVVLTFGDLAISYILVLIVLAVSYLEKLELAKEIFIGSVRAFLQLVAIGYVLKFIFAAEKWYVISAMLIFMLLFAAYNGKKRIKQKFRNQFSIFATSLVVGAGSVIVFGMIFILHLKPWYKPQYIIPMFGMVVANAMTSISLGLNELSNSISNNKNIIMVRLSLGFSPYHAILPYLKSSIRTSLIPIINAMVVIGIVQLPGMMTGQIIGGVSPLDAVKYQIIIMYMILSANAISSIVAIFQGYKVFFNNRGQLIIFNNSFL